MVISAPLENGTTRAKAMGHSVHRFSEEFAWLSLHEPKGDIALGRALSDVMTTNTLLRLSYALVAC
jgi:hypothetical protein